MPDVEPVKRQIRFFLSELSTRNEHHAFERLCEEVAKARICSNVVPATGPVSAGGDQGRDFETFRTYLEGSDIHESAFLGMASEGVLVFACSTEKDPQTGKIRSDVDKIMARGEAPERIYFFSAHNVPVGRRHAVQDEVREEYGVEVEVFDAQWLGEQLSTPDLFWVAEKYLDVPSAVYPVPSGSSAEGVTREGLEARSRFEDTEARRYITWLAGVTSSFVVPGLDVSLPIEKAWVRLRAHADPDWVRDPPESLAKWLEMYREWGRLAEQGSGADKVFGAEQIIHAGGRVVVVGGPGAGKSTLLKRLAHRLAVATEDVLLVRLPMVLRVMDGGHGFEEAVVKVAADGSGLDEATARRVLGRPGYLLADGLDECDPRRQLIADALRGWSEGHPDAKVVVTTRPVGHNPAHLPEWEYVELLPLAGSRVREYAGLLLESIPLPEGSDIEEHLDAFERSLEDNKAASLAARNPLLLGFLVQLSASGVGFGESRAGLYRRIVGQMADRPLHDREPRVEVDDEVARYSFGAVGWILQREQDLSRRDLVERLGELLHKELGVTALAGRREADKCLRFWEERRVIERLTAGSEDAVRFLHLGLAEYAAGVFASGLDDGALRDWVREVRRKPRWRETLLLAAGAGAVEGVAAALLELDNRDDPAAVETELALAALAEVPAPPRELVREAASHLHERLVADVPLVAFEATEVALGLASQAPEIVGPVVRSLTGHPQEWTRLCAIRLASACGGGWADLDALEAFVDETVSGASREAASEDRLGQRRGIFTWGFEQEMLLEGIESLLRERPGEDTTRRVEQAYQWEFIGTGTFEKLTDLLRRHGGHNDLIKRAHERHGYGLLNAEKWLRDERERKDKDLAVLEAILRATDVPREADLPEPTGELTELSKLVYGMGWPDAAVTAVDVMRYRRDLDAVDAVFRGAIAALELDPTRLAAEAALAKSRFEEDDGLVSGRLWSQVVEVPAVPRWELTSDADLPAEDLVRALKHPSAPIVNNAVALLEHGAGGAAVPALLERAARTGTEYTSHATAYLAPRIWGEQALNKLLDILGAGPVTSENRGMLLTLPDLPGAEDDDRVLRLFARGLMSEDPDAATDVAEELFKTQSLNLSPMIAQMEEALEHWTGRGTWCDRDDIPVYGSSCPRCSTIPPSPRGHLIRILAGLGRMQPERLADLTADSRHDVREAATEALAEAAASSPPMLDDILARVGSGELQPSMLDKTLSLPPAPLQESKGALTALLGSPSADVRERVLRAMAGLRWIGREEAVDLARRASQDRAPAVRDQAAKTLRSLQSG